MAILLIAMIAMTRWHSRAKRLPKPRQSASVIVRIEMDTTILINDFVTVSHPPNGCGKHCTPFKGTVVAGPSFSEATNEIFIKVRSATNADDIKTVTLLTRSKADIWHRTGWYIRPATLPQAMRQH